MISEAWQAALQRRFLRFCRWHENGECVVWIGRSQVRLATTLHPVKPQSCTPTQAAWWAAIGPVPAGRQIRRTCSTHGCVRHIAALPVATAARASGRRGRRLLAEEVEMIRNLPHLTKALPHGEQKAFGNDLREALGISRFLFNRVRSPSSWGEIYAEVPGDRPRYASNRFLKGKKKTK